MPHYPNQGLPPHQPNQTPGHPSNKQQQFNYPPMAAANPAYAAAYQQQQQQQAAMMMPQRSRPCVRCGYPGCDVMITACRCCLHARCAPIPIRTCPNPRCMHPRMELMNNTTTNGNTNESRPSHPLELLPMEFDELDESRRVATLTEAASRRAKEKQRARKKAKLESTVMAGQQQQQHQNNGSSSNVTLSTANSSGTSTAGGMEGDNGGNVGGQFPDDISIDSQSMMNNNHPQQQQQQLPTPDNQMSMSSNNSIRSSTSTDTSLLSSSSTALPPSSTAPIIAGGISPELRTGRWTAEETHYCDTLVSKFMAGRLPLPDGIKLNEFLSSMLKSKQSRLTKKMKNAKLSSKTFRRTTGYLTSELEAREYSEAEDAFFHSLQNQLERCEMRFHTRKEWGETFSTYCVSHGQMLNADAWLVSIDEMDRRVHRAKDRMRMERRKLMIGHALRHDLKNPNRGVVIDKVNNDANGGGSGGDYGGSMSGGSVTDNGGGIGASSASSYNNGNNNLMDSNANGQYSSYSMSGNDPMLAADQQQQPQQLHQFEMDQQRARARSLSFALDGVGQSMASPFLNRIINFIHRHHIPFEYVDAWVPSFVPDGKDSSADGGDGSQGGGESVASGQQQQMKPDQDVDLHSNSGEQKQQQPQPKCRLCFAGSIVAKQVIVGGDGTNQYRRSVPLSSDDQFNLAAFGDYSESFSFDVGCGLPGRVYHMGVPTWEQSVHNAPLHHFERVGGSQQWGIRTVVGIPVPSPNVGRVVVILYSRHDRPKDHDMVIRLTDEFTRLLPSPKWKLVVDVGQQQQQQQQQQQVAQQEQKQQQQQQQDLTAAAPPSEDPAALSSEVISIFGEHMPSDPNSPAFAYLQGFMSLRLLLLRQNRGGQEQDLVNTMLSSYSSYKAGGRTPADIALMLARDFMFLSQQQQQQQQQSSVSSPHGNHQFSQPAQYQQQPAVQNNGVHVSASPRLQPASPNNGSSMPPPSYHSSTSLMQPQQVNQEQDRLQHNFQEALVNGTVSNMLLGGDDDVTPTPVSEMINAAAAAAVSAAAADGGLGSLAS
mmetsp:Transcript_7907/g.11988  ORF Transcript_7907/g.11988 Transcript_7907/m.11988 type:complete len:1048 (-) Transcript_7907:200-3343(-)